MATSIENVMEIFGLLLGVIPIAIGLFILVWIGSILRARIEKRFKTSWVISSLVAAFILLFILLTALYLIPSGFQLINSNDAVPTGINQVIDTDIGVASSTVPESANIFAGIVGVLFHVLVVAIVLMFLSFPFILVGSMLEGALFSNPKKSSLLVARMISVYVMTLAAIIVLLAFPWVWAGIAFFFFFS